MVEAALEAALEALAKWAVPLVCGAVCTGAAALMRRERKKIDAIGDGMRALLRAELIRAHRDYVEEGSPITLQARTHLGAVYEAYHDLNGNGSATKLWEDIKRLEVKA